MRYLKGNASGGGRTGVALLIVTVAASLVVASASYAAAGIVLAFGLLVAALSYAALRRPRILLPIAAAVLVVLLGAFWLLGGGRTNPPPLVGPPDPVALADYRSALHPSSSDANTLAASERFTVRMAGRAELAPLGDLKGLDPGAPITVDEMRAEPAPAAIAAISRGATPLAVPFEMLPGLEYTIEVSRPITTTRKGFLVREVSLTPSRLPFTWSQPAKGLSGVHHTISVLNGRTPIAVELDDFPKGALFGSNTPYETLPFGNTVIVRWQIEDARRPLRFLYIPRPYQALRWLLRPVLGVTAASELLLSLAGIAVPLAVGLVIAARTRSLPKAIDAALRRLKRRRGDATAGGPPAPPEEGYDPAAIRALLRAAFTAKDLPRFLHDRPAFRPILDDLGPDAGLNDAIEHVIVYSEKQLLLDELLAEIAKANPKQYARFGPYRS